MLDIWNTNKVFRNEKSKKTVNRHLYRLHSLRKAGLPPHLGSFLSSPTPQRKSDETIGFSRKILHSTSQPLKKVEKKSVSEHTLCFCKKKEESFVFASRRPIFFHFVVSHLFYGTPFRLKYCSVVYNVCLIKHNVHLPPLPPVSNEPEFSWGDFASKVTL